MIYDGPKLSLNDLPFCLNNMPCGGFIKVEYLNTIDGDTAYFKVGNTNESVRLFLINTPEVYKDEPYALYAKEYTKSIYDKLGFKVIIMDDKYLNSIAGCLKPKLGIN